MENSEEILHSLEEFSKLKPRDIPRELEDYLCFVAKTGDPVYQWGTVKSLFKEKLLSVIADFYEACPSVDIPPCPNVEVFNYESMKVFILEKLDTFVAAPFTVQRICELLTTPRKEYNRIDKYMRALEKNILVVSTTEPGNRHPENGDGVVNGLESDHILESNSSNNDINVEEMDDSPVWSRMTPDIISYQSSEANVEMSSSAQCTKPDETATAAPSFEAEVQSSSECVSTIESVITCRPSEDQPYVSIEPIVSDSSDSCMREDTSQDSNITVTITAIPAAVQKRRDSIEPVVSTEEDNIKVEEDKPVVTVAPLVAAILPAETTSEVEVSGSEEKLYKTNAAFLLAHEEFDEFEGDTDLEVPTDASTEDLVLDEIPLTSEVEPDLDMLVEEPKPSIPDCPSEEVKEESSTSEAVAEDVTSSGDAEIVAPVCLDNADKEVLVSSTDEEPIIAKSEEVEKKEEPLVEGSDQSDKVESEPNVEVDLGDIQEFASSSTCHVPMDIDLGEESCQEPPTSEEQ